METHQWVFLSIISAGVLYFLYSVFRMQKRHKEQEKHWAEQRELRRQEQQKIDKMMKDKWLLKDKEEEQTPFQQAAAVEKDALLERTEAIKGELEVLDGDMCDMCNEEDVAAKPITEAIVRSRLQKIQLMCTRMLNTIKGSHERISNEQASLSKKQEEPVSPV